MAIAQHVKAPGAILDYTLDWSAYLGDGDTIASASWSVSGVTKVTEGNTTTTATVRISGGTVGADASAKCHVVLASGQEDERTITIAVQEL